MRSLIGWLLLLPLIFAFWLTMTIANGCARRESGSWRLLGVLASLAIGGVCARLGWSLGPEDGLIIGWITLIAGGLIAILGTWTALVGTKEEIEQREKMENQEKIWKQEEQDWAKEEAKKILEQGEINNYELVGRICNVLDKTGVDWGAIGLKQDLEKLKEKQIKREKGNIQR